jgi:predicted membrane protein
VPEIENCSIMQNNKSDSRMIIGILLIVLGVLFMFESMGLMELSIGKYVFSWKTFLIFLGLILFFNKKRKVSGIVLMSLGVSFWFPSLFGVDVRFHQVFLPLALIGVGALIVSKRGRVNREEKFVDDENGEKVYESDVVNDLPIFGGAHKIIESKNFKGGTLTSVFGSTELNLVNAEMEKECIIDVFTLFGGTTLIIPNDWKVESDAVTILGGFNDKRRIVRSEVDPDKTLVIKGVVIFGGIEVKSY